MKSFDKQFLFGGIAALVLGLFTAGCNKSSDYGTEPTTNAVETAAAATTNAAVKAWDATKEGAKDAGDAMKDAAGKVKEGVTNAWDSLTSTNH